MRLTADEIKSFFELDDGGIPTNGKIILFQREYGMKTLLETLLWMANAAVGDVSYNSLKSYIQVLKRKIDNKSSKIPMEMLEEYFENGEAAASSSTEDHICLICADHSDGLHFGIYACRACTAFFRRTVVLNKKYVCRKGGQNCRINKSIRSMCRKCRFDRCLELGMIEEMVQNRRDPNIEYVEDLEPLSACPDSPEMTEKPTPSKSKNRKRASSYLLPDLEIIEQPEFLNSIRRNYRALLESERRTELDGKLQSDYGIFKGDLYDLPEYTRITCRRLFKLNRANRPFLHDFLSTTFPEYNNLLFEEKGIVLVHFFLLKWIIDSAFRTYRKLPPYEYGKKVLYTETCYVDIDHLKELASDMPTGSFDKNEVLNVMRSTFTGPRGKIVNEFHEMRINEQEYLALLTTAIWSENIDKSTDAIEATGKEIRKRMYQQLHLYYRSQGKIEYVERLCEVLQMNNSIAVAYNRLKQDLELYNLFDAFKMDKGSLNFIKVKCLCNTNIRDTA